MSPIFTPDFTKVDASFPLYERGRYQVKTMRATPFTRKGQPDAEGNVKVSAGVRYALEMVGKFDEDGELQREDLEGKMVEGMVIYLHTDKGWSMGKPFLMAANGYNVKEQESDANEDFFQVQDWTFDGEPDMDSEQIELGDGWHTAVDKILDVTLSTKTREYQGESRTDQKFAGWAPVEG